MTRFLPRTLAFLLTLALLPAISTAAIVHVSKDGDGSDPSTWAGAFQTIVAAVSGAAGGDTIWVKEGDYNEAPFLTKRLFLLGGFSGTESEESQRNPHIHKTKIRLTSGTLPAIRCGAPCTIDGFEVSSANNGGMTLYRASAIVVDTTFTNCLRGGVAVTEGTIDMLRCNIIKNWGSSPGIYLTDQTTATITDSLIANNRGGSDGGGIVCVRSTLTMTNCRILNNAAPDPGDPEGYFSTGGGLELADAIASINNCLISNNFADRGANIYLWNDAPGTVFQNCTVIRSLGHSDSIESDVLWNAKSPIFRNVIIWGNNNMLVRGDHAEGDADITYSCVQGGYPGEGNISDDPKFVDAANGDFHLLPDSPCIDSASFTGPLVDLDGNPRPIDIPFVGRSGETEFDMGCYEFQLPAPLPTPTLNPNSDIDQNGKVDANDLIILLTDWKKVSGP